MPSAAGRAARVMRAVRDIEVVIESCSNSGKSPRLAFKSKYVVSGYEPKYMLHDPREESQRACRQSPARTHRLHLRTTIQLPHPKVVPGDRTDLLRLPRAKHRRNAKHEVLRQTTGRLNSCYSSLTGLQPRWISLACLGCLG
jgi:hypothetical protein